MVSSFKRLELARCRPTGRSTGRICLRCRSGKSAGELGRLEPMSRLILLLSLALASVSVHAEVEKSFTQCPSGLCLHWWPKLPGIKGWHQELGQSQYFGFNALAPDGSTFKDSESVIYAKASYKPRDPDTKSLEAFIESDKADFASSDSSIVITALAPLQTADGKKLSSFTYFPTSGGNWECVSYGEEGEFYLTFVLSARSKAAYEKAFPSFKAMINAYKERL